MKDDDQVKHVSVDENEVDQHGRNDTTDEENIDYDRQNDNPFNTVDVDDDQISDSDPVADSDIEFIYGTSGTGLFVERDGGTDFE